LKTNAKMISFSLVIGLSAVVIPSLVILRQFRKFRKGNKLLKDDWEKDVVYLYQFYRIKCIASISPFALKLETWLRLKKIKYESYEGTKFSRGGGQVPFIELNGVEIFDSNVIIPYLREHFKLSDTFPDEVHEGAAHAAMRMLDQHTVYTYFWYRYVEHWRDEFFPLWTFPIPGLVRVIIRYVQPRGNRKKGWTIGHGRLQTAQIYQLGMDDFKALSKLLGKKSFLGGEVITTADCCAFGHLCQIFDIPLSHPFKPFVEEECPNLRPYADRIKSCLWPDWHQLCQSGW